MRDGIGASPFSVVLSPNGAWGFVNNTASHDVSAIRMSDRKVIARIPTGEIPICMAVHPSGRTLWVGCEGTHDVYVIDIPQDMEKGAEMEELCRIEVIELHRFFQEWFAGELAYLAKRLADTPEPGGDGSMLDYTQIVWLNELGKGNSHMLDNIPFVLVGGGCGFKTGRSLDFEGAAHNQLWLAVANGMGHGISKFGKKGLCEGGALRLG